MSNRVSDLSEFDLAGAASFMGEVAAQLKGHQEVRERLAAVEADLAAVRARLDWFVRSQGQVRAWSDNAPSWRWSAYSFDGRQSGHGPTSDAAIDDAIAKGDPSSSNGPVFE